jgi:hypothetical protein
MRKTGQPKSPSAVQTVVRSFLDLKDSAFAKKSEAFFIPYRLCSPYDPF